MREDQLITVLDIDHQEEVRNYKLMNDCMFDVFLPIVWLGGDPHITTLDGLQYTFNGLGEFILFELNDNSFTMQGRTDRVSDDVEATKFSSLAFKENTSETIEIKVKSIPFL